MRRFRDLPIKQKLTLTIVLISSGALLMASAAGLVYEWSASRDANAHELKSLAEILAANIRAALAFQDVDAAETILHGLDSRPDVMAARIFDAEGNVFARYISAGVPESTLTPRPRRHGHYFEDDWLVVAHPIRLQGELLGTLQLRSDLTAYRLRLRTAATILAEVMLGLVGVVVIVSARFQRILSEPILQLANLARRISEEKDYSLRAPPTNKDELGTLTDGFNEMLGQIQKRDDDLRASEERFRQMAEGIREVFWMTDCSKNEMIYISPGYEQIWQRRCEHLYRYPQSWIDAIHPGDRERVSKDALTKQATGQYDEEYRIMRPDGSVRWIRDRAFPVRNKEGTVYRIAGIAEDVTERRSLEQQILEISDQEKQRIGQDLHDGLCQHLTATSLAAKVLEETLADKKLGEATDVHRLGQFISQAITQARQIARGLNPVEIDENGLTTALQELANGVNSLFSVSCRFRSHGTVAMNDHVAASHLYRIAQEATHNAVKHAGARTIELSLTAQNHDVILAVQDDGRGITPPSGRMRGMGMHSMRYRARLLGANLEVQSSPGHGTTVRCVFPWGQPNLGANPTDSSSKESS